MLLHTQAASLLRTARREAGLTQQALASRLGVPQSVVARMERPGSNPTWDTVSATLVATGHELRLVRRRSQASIDLDQIRLRLRLSPAERLRLFQESHRHVADLVATARRQRAD
jgi:transcriptional regulator with XRE-family HTH domain